MITRTANILKLDNIEAEKFLKAVEESNCSKSPKVLLPDRKLNDVLIEFTKTIDSPETVSNQKSQKYQLYLIIEDELLCKTKDRYFVLVADVSEEDNLRNLAFQIRDVLMKLKINSFFRIDPQHGLVMGSTKNTITPFFSDPTSRICIVNYLVPDINHHGVATYEYVDRNYRREYIKVFKKVNGCLPKRLPKIFEKSLYVFRKRKESVILKHTDLQTIIKHLLENNYKDICLHILYENLSQYELDNLALDTVAASFLFQGQGRFFITLDDLLNNPASA
ncbi:MAG: hypothetical protein A2161_22315 [Candidatus Schekmanbacteria bacterium RBG_13_48_7]|uniref:Uncharacterized protein n=1 Tax=Candidatus Schekmanbacteria bacterium RBG_13_48_7 TaxID=1817878 RepID=A0A1F7RZY5_9BACT|nr:MAG: hypothetical protein A2161_22315 [Candidatus Schekmanbacteria bacterium RBG_13_48_7]